MGTSKQSAMRRSGDGFVFRQLGVGKRRKLAVNRRPALPKLVRPKLGKSPVGLPVTNRSARDPEKLGQRSLRPEDLDDVIGSHRSSLQPLNGFLSRPMNGKGDSLNNMTTTPERLQLILDEMRIKPAEFARLVGVSRASVSYWLKGTTKPSPENVFSIADQTGYSPRWIATGEGPQKGDGAMPLRMQLKEDEYNLLVVFQSLPNELKTRLMDYARGLADAVYLDTAVRVIQQRSGP